MNHSAPAIAPPVEIPPEIWPSLADLVDPTEESVAFLVGDPAGPDKPPRIRAVWWEENVWEEREGGRTRAEGFAIGRKAWEEARERAKALGVAVLGTMHTHLGANPWPSFWDYRTVKRADEIHAVFYPRGRMVTFYTVDSDRAGRVVGCAEVALGPCLAAMADLTWIEEGDAPDLQGITPIIRWFGNVPDSDIAIQSARDLLAELDDAGSDLAAVGTNAERVAALRQAVEGHG